jgi:hypothetical protein
MLDIYYRSCRSIRQGEADLICKLPGLSRRMSGRPCLLPVNSVSSICDSHPPTLPRRYSRHNMFTYLNDWYRSVSGSADSAVTP